MRALLAVAAVILLAGLLGLLAGDRLSGEWSTDELMRLLYLAVLGGFVGLGFFSGGWQHTRKDFRDLAFWVGALLLLTGLYAFKDDARLVGERMLGTLIPGRAVQTGGDISIARSAGGMFIVDGRVNGEAVQFIFDTGASGVSLTAGDAQRAGINPAAADYTMSVRTANGVAMVAPVVIDSIQVGGVTLRNVRGSVSRPGALTRSLLGHTFLDRLTSYEVRGDRLILRGPR